MDLTKYPINQATVKTVLVYRRLQIENFREFQFLGCSKSDLTSRKEEKTFQKGMKRRKAYNEILEKDWKVYN